MCAFEILFFALENALIDVFGGERKKVEMQDKNTRVRSCQQTVIGRIKKNIIITF